MFCRSEIYQQLKTQRVSLLKCDDYHTKANPLMIAGVAKILYYDLTKVCINTYK